MRYSDSSDAGGRVALPITNGGSLRIALRKIGWQPVDTTLDAARLIAPVEFRMTRTPVALDTVIATARGRVLSNDYLLGASEIAASRRYIVDAYDALRDLRPGMLGDRLRDCPYARNLWVNGRRQPLSPAEPLIPLEGAPMIARNDGSGRPPLSGAYLPSHAPPGAPLSLIKAEHIAEMRYVSCWQRSQVGVGGDNAIFITLRPGVAFDLRRGSYVRDSASARAAHVIP